MAQTSNVNRVKYCCEVCLYETHKKSNYLRHIWRKHGNGNYEASPIVKAPMPLQQPVSCRDVQTQTNPLQVANPYLTRDVGTQYPEYADSMVSEMESDNSITDSESDTSSVVSDIDINLKSLLSELEKVQKKLPHLHQELKTQKNKWSRLTKKLGGFNKMDASEKQKFKEIVDAGMAFDREVRNYNSENGETNDSQSQNGGSDSGDSTIGDSVHGASCWDGFLEPLRDGVEEFPDASNIYEECNKEWKILQNKKYDEFGDTEDELDNDNMEESEIVEESDKTNEEMCNLENNIRRTIVGYKNEGIRYLINCPNQAIEDIGWCCNKFLHEYFIVNNTQNKKFIREHVNPIEETTIEIADPSVPVHRKKELLQEKQVGNGIMGLLARVILPIITSLFNQKGGSVDDNLGVKFKGSETLQRCRGIGGCIKFLK